MTLSIQKNKILWPLRPHKKIVYTKPFRFKVISYVNYDPKELFWKGNFLLWFEVDAYLTCLQFVPTLNIKVKTLLGLCHKRVSKVGQLKKSINR